MKKLWRNKKIYVAILVILLLVLAGIIVVISPESEKDSTETGKDTSGQDIIVHDANEDTVEEKSEDGLTESDSEDGPVVNEDHMIDFNGSGDEDADNSMEENPTEWEEPEDTGTYGTFY